MFNLFKFIDNHEKRKMLSKKPTFSKERVSDITRKAAELLNEQVEKLNLRIPCRNIPYIKFSKYVAKNDKGLEDRIRITLEDDKADNPDTSFVVNIKVSDNEKVFVIQWENCDIVLMSNVCDVCEVIVDSLLDSAMFNSFSVLKEFSLTQKREFSMKKLEFRQAENLDSERYIFYKGSEPECTYYSLAFLCRGENEFDMEKYIDLWSKFMNTYYQNEADGHINEPIEEQLKHHTEYEQLDVRGIIAELRRKDSGTYFFLRINRVNRIKKDTRASSHIRSYFGEVCRGNWTLIPFAIINEFEDYCNNEQISAFKIIKD